MPVHEPAFQSPIASGNSHRLLEQYKLVRSASERLCEPLAVEDYVIQSMPDASPAKWHLAHTTWFFETFVLKPATAGYKSFDERFGYLFNSYYLAAGERHCRPRRGLLSRPTVREVYDYRHAIDQQMIRLLDRDPPADVAGVIELGLHHEQQHQELLLTDIKHAFWVNPLRPVYQKSSPQPTPPPAPMRWVSFAGGLDRIGHGGDSFAYDNESPRHQVLLQGFDLGSRLVSSGEYRAFIDDGGYRRGELWLSEGWSTVRNQQWTAPLYWEQRDGQWWNMTLGGMRPVEDSEPVCHLSYFEADAFARWAGARLPREAEWEVAAAGLAIEGSFVEAGQFHPAPCHDNQNLAQMFGELWQWTASPYVGYPGYKPPPGAIGEYNGKFMCNQWVLRGGSCATPRSHIRRTYRNFFPADARWQFTGLRLARDA